MKRVIFLIFAFVLATPLHAYAQSLSQPEIQALRDILRCVKYDIDNEGHPSIIIGGQPTAGIFNERGNGCNLRIINGLDSTTTTNGRGNLIVGYDESPSNFERDGSHNISVGIDNGYSSYGTFIVGQSNQTLGPYSSISGGRRNTAGGKWSSVSGGFYNAAEGQYSSVSGGGLNFAAGTTSHVGGGFQNSSDGYYSSISGGR